MSEKRLLKLLLLPVWLLLAACGGGEAPTPLPSDTPPPTAPPGIATPIPAGFEANPLRMMILPVDPEAAAERVDDLEQTIQEISTVYVEIVLVESYAEAIAALCDMSGEMLSAAWLDATGYAVVSARRCGDAVIQLEKPLNGTPTTGDRGVILLNGDFNTPTIGVLRNRTFCRLSHTDFYSWLLPSLYLYAAGLDPAGLSDIVNYETQDALLAAVQAGDCAGTGMSQSDYQALLDSGDETVASLLPVEGLPEVTMPHQILMYPFQIPLQARLRLNNAFLYGMAEVTEDDLATLASPVTDPEATEEPVWYAGLLEPFLGTDAVPVAIETGDLDALDEFLAQTGLDFVELGQ